VHVILTIFPAVTIAMGLSCLWTVCCRFYYWINALLQSFSSKTLVAIESLSEHIQLLSRILLEIFKTFS